MQTPSLIGKNKNSKQITDNTDDNQRTLFIVLLGAPGAGKGTQAEFIKKDFNIPAISTGNMLRDQIKQQTDLGKKVEQIMNSGDLVSDSLVLEIFLNRIAQPDCENGAIIDGIPRNLKQAEMLEQGLKEQKINVDIALYINLETEEIIKRLSGRWTCKANNHSYHEIFNPPKNPGICDIDRSPLYQREDQKPEAVEERIKIFQQEIEPLLDFYKSRSLLKVIDGGQSIAQVKNDIAKALSVAKTA